MMKKFISKYTDYNLKPIKSGMIVGVWWSLIFLLIASTILLSFIFTPAALLVMRLILTLLIYAGYPWRFFLDNSFFLFDTILPIIINGIILGIAFGFYKKFSALRKINKQK